MGSGLGLGKMVAIIPIGLLRSYGQEIIQVTEILKNKGATHLEAPVLRLNEKNIRIDLSLLGLDSAWVDRNTGMEIVLRT